MNIITTNTMPKPEQKSITAFLNVQDKREKECVTVTDDLHIAYRIIEINLTRDYTRHMEK